MIHEMLVDNDAYPVIGMIAGILGGIGILIAVGVWIGSAVGAK